MCYKKETGIIKAVLDFLKRIFNGKTNENTMEEGRNFGLVLSKMDGSEHIFATEQPATSMPPAYSYKRFLPGVVNQGMDSICVPCSLSAYLNWKQNLETGSKKDNKVDYFEIYDKRGHEWDGMSFKQALGILRHEGVASASGRLGIHEYALISSKAALQTAILMNGPCVGALPVYNDSPRFWKEQKNDGFYGYHAISIVGYDKDGFIIRNSWGPKFGDNGYTTLKYEDFGQFVEIWTILD